MHFSVDDDFAAGEFVEDGAKKIDLVGFAAATERRIREEGDAGIVGEDDAGDSVGLLDDFDELVAGRGFAGGDVGEDVDFVAALHDDEAGKSSIRGVGKGHAENVVGVGDGSGEAGHGEGVAAGQNDVAAGIGDAADDGVGGAAVN